MRTAIGVRAGAPFVMTFDQDVAAQKEGAMPFFDLFTIFFARLMDLLFSLWSSALGV